MNYTPSEMEQMAVISIRNYLRKPWLTDAQVKEKYVMAIKVLINNATALLNNKVVGVTSMSQGSQSMTFKDTVEAFAITEDVKMLLPKQRVGVQ